MPIPTYCPTSPANEVKLALRSGHWSLLPSLPVVLFGEPRRTLHGYWIGALVTGLALMLIDSLSNLIWFVQIRGIIILTKLLCLALALLKPEWSTPILLAVVFISGVIAHAPSKWRYHSVYHGYIIQSKYDSKADRPFRENMHV